MFAAVATLFTACNKECEHEFIEYDHSKDLVGTWTCHQTNVSAAMEIKADGSVIATTLANGEYSENVPGKIEVENNKVCLTLEDGTIFKGLLEIILGESFVIVDEESGLRLTHHLCKQDISKEIVGMWVSNNGPTDMENEIQIRTYDKDGIVTTTGVRTIDGNAEWMLNEESKYRVVGDLIFKTRSKEVDGQLKVSHSAERFVYAPKGTALGDIMNVFFYLPMGDNYVESVVSFLRIKQTLDLANNSYDYSNIYVTNVKAKDAEFEFAGQTLNLATMDGRILDKMMKNLLFNVSFPSANEIVYNYHYNGENIPMPAPIVVDGNKMTIKKSVSNPIYKDIDVWTFQDQDNTQMHMYMPTYAFENFLANTAVEMMAQNGELDLNDAEAVATIYNGVADAIETINVSFIFKAAK